MRALEKKSRFYSKKKRVNDGEITFIERGKKLSGKRGR